MTTCLPRRALIQGALTMPLASVVAVASPDHPDAELFALQPEVDRLDQAYDAARKVYGEIERRCMANRPEAPEELRPRGRCTKAAFDAWLERCDRSDEAFELAEADEALSAIDEQRLDLRDEISRTHARSLEGLIWKARYAHTHFPGDPDGEVACSIYDDVLAMVGITATWPWPTLADAAPALA